MEQNNTEEEWYGVGSSKYDPDIHVPRLLEIFEKGEGVAAFCTASNISMKSFQVWCQKYPEFKAQYEIAITIGRADWERKFIDLSQRGISFNHTFFMTIYRNRYKYRLNKIGTGEEVTTKERLEAAWKSLNDGKITSQEYNQIASGLANESKIVELELKRDELNKDKGKEIPKEVTDAAVEAFMLVKSGKGKIVMVEESEK